MRLLSWFGLFLSLILGFPALAAEPSFDCAKAEGSAEQLVCDDQQLAALDRELARLFGLAAKGPHMDDERLKELRAYQRGWIKGRNDCWKADDLRACVQNSYGERIFELRQGYFDARQEDDDGLSSGPLALECQGLEAVIGATFIQAPEPLAVLVWRDRKVTLAQSKAASGGRYQGRSFDGDYGFWIKGEEARFTMPEGEPLNCRFVPTN